MPFAKMSADNFKTVYDNNLYQLLSSYSDSMESRL